jgi:hypothetical protein
MLQLQQRYGLSSRVGQQQQRQAVLCRAKVLHGDHGHGDHHVAWYQKHKVGSPAAGLVACHLHWAGTAVLEQYR